MVSSAASTFQVSLSVLPHVEQTTLTVGNCLSDATFRSITAISTGLELAKFIFCTVISFRRSVWYLHFGHLSEGSPFLIIWSNAPHLGQKFILVRKRSLLAQMIFYRPIQVLHLVVIKQLVVSYTKVSVRFINISWRRESQD
jgi:hypothetical protein